MFIVPAGLLVIGRCTDCGGRVERLVEFEDLTRQGVAAVGSGGPGARPAHAAKPDGTGALGTALQHVFGVLVEGHRPCDSSPAGHRVAPLTKQFLRKALADASRDLESDGRTAGKLYLLMEDGRGCAVGTEHLIRGAPAPSAERTANRAAGVEALRRYLGGLDLTASAAVLIGEAWASPLEEYEQLRPGQTERNDVIVASLVTARFGRIGCFDAPAALRVHYLKHERGTNLDWWPLTEPAPLTDGIFAGRTQRTA